MFNLFGKLLFLSKLMFRILPNTLILITLIQIIDYYGDDKD